MSTRTLERSIAAVAASDGAGVKLWRSLGQTQNQRHDPFLLLDEFCSDHADDYIRGFPPHPHRGFETVTYMLDGRMRHEDSAGHRGDLGPGDVQWMTAARGIIHSEMPQQQAGRLRGFQLWLNLPAKTKMQPAAYRDIPAQAIPLRHLAGGGTVRVIAGAWAGTVGAVQRPDTEPLYLDVHLPPQATFNTALPTGHQAFTYLYEGAATVGTDPQALPLRAAGILSAGEDVRLTAGPAGARLLLLAGQPLQEPVVQYGPFVMNSREEIEQALADYRDGRLATA